MPQGVPCLAAPCAFVPFGSRFLWLETLVAPPASRCAVSCSPMRLCAVRSRFLWWETLVAPHASRCAVGLSATVSCGWKLWWHLLPQGVPCLAAPCAFVPFGSRFLWLETLVAPLASRCAVTFAVAKLFDAVTFEVLKRLAGFTTVGLGTFSMFAVAKPFDAVSFEALVRLVGFITVVVTFTLCGRHKMPGGRPLILACVFTVV